MQTNRTTNTRKPYSSLFTPLLFLLASLLLYSNAFAQAPALNQAAQFALLAGKQIDADNQLVAQGAAGAVNLIDTDIYATGGDYPNNSSPVPAALTDLQAAKNHCSNLGGTTINANLTGQSLSAGVYSILSNAQLTANSPLTLTGNSTSVFIFNIKGSLTVSQNAVVSLIGVLPQNVYWNISSTLVTGGLSSFSGIAMCGSYIEVSDPGYGAMALLSLSHISLKKLSPVTEGIFISEEESQGQEGVHAICNDLPACSLNVIRNGGFEVLTEAQPNGCPAGPSNMGTISNPASDVCTWTTGHLYGTPDYYNRCAPATFPNLPQNPFVWVPVNRGGDQESMSGGDAYAGIIAYGDCSGNIGPNEYIRAEIAPMEQGRRYYGEFYVSLGETSRYAINQMGMWVSTGHPVLSTSPPTGTNYLTQNGLVITPQIRHDGNSFLDDTQNWVKISGCYPPVGTATGTETHVTIGNFHPAGVNNGFNTITVDANADPCWAYYFIDNVSLTRIPTAGPDHAICLGNSVQLGEACALPESSGATYSWVTDGDINSLSSTEVSNPIATPTETTTYTLFVEVCGSVEMSLVTVTVYEETTPNPACCHMYSTNTNIPAQINSSTPVGGVVTSNSGGMVTLTAPSNQTVIFDGIYHVSSRLRLTGPGTFRMNPGTVLFFDATQGSSYAFCANFDVDPQANFLLVDAGFLEMQGARLTSTCERVWGGVFLTNSSTFVAGPDPATGDSSYIHNAYIGVASYQNNCDVSNSNYYEITRTSFYNNFYGIIDLHKAQAQSGEGVTFSTFWTKAPMLASYFQNPVGPVDLGFGGIVLEKRDVAFSPSDMDYANAEFSGNIFRGLRRFGFNGLANNLLLTDNDFERIIHHSVSLEAFPGNTNTIQNNYIMMQGLDNSYQVERVGIVAGNGAVVFNNYVESDVTDPYLYTMPNTAFSLTQTVLPASNYAPKRLVGVWTVHSNAIMEENEFRYLTEALRASFGPLSPTSPVTRFRRNRSHGNVIGIRVTHGNPYTQGIQLAEIRCNTFDNANVASGNLKTYGLLIMTNAQFNSVLGSTQVPNGPNGNAFVNISETVRNDGPNSLTYHSYSSAQEVVGISGSGGGNVPLPTQTPNNNTCPGFNGVSTQRVTGNTLAAIQEMMDSLRYNVGSLEDMRYYLDHITTYHLDNNLVADLETYTNSLPSDNLFAYNALALFLMEHHRSQQNEVAAAALVASVESHNPNDTEIFWHCRYFDVIGRVGTRFQVGFQPDSTDLAMLSNIANSGTANSEMACLVLHFYTPGTPCTSSGTARNLPAMDQVGKGHKNRAASLGLSYPNPAYTEATIPYTLPAEVSAASIQVHDLVKGTSVQEYLLPVKEGKNALKVDLQGLASGVYSYTLLVDGKPVKTEKMVVIK